MMQGQKNLKFVNFVSRFCDHIKLIHRFIGNFIHSFHTEYSMLYCYFAVGLQFHWWLLRIVVYYSPSSINYSFRVLQACFCHDTQATCFLTVTFVTNLRHLITLKVSLSPRVEGTLTAHSLFKCENMFCVRTALFGAITQRWVPIPYWPYWSFGTTYRSYLQGAWNHGFLTLKDGNDRLSWNKVKYQLDETV